MLRDVGPVRAAVGGFIDAASRAAADQRPGKALRLPHRCVERVRVLQIDHDVVAAGIRIDVQYLAPRLAAVGRFVDAALGVRLEHVPHRRRVRDVRIARIDDQRGGLVRFAQPGVRPRRASVGALEDAVAGVEVLADIAFAGSRIDHARIGGRDGQRADRGGRRRQLSVADVHPVLPVVGAFPNAALNAAHVEQVAAGDGGNRHDAPADVRSDTAPLQLAHELLRRRRRSVGCRRRKER